MKFITAIFLAAMATTVQAGQMLVTVDFNSSTAPFQFRNECHDGPGDDRFWPDPAGDGTFWMSLFCPHGGQPHPDGGYPDIGRPYLPQVWIRHQYGHPFTLLGFESDSSSLQVRSSRGGEIVTGGDNVQCGDPGNPDCVWDLRTDITDPLFRNVQWVSFCPECADDFNYPDHVVGLYDNVRFSIQVPEPAPLTLISIALVGLAFIRRRALSIA